MGSEPEKTGRFYGGPVFLCLNGSLLPGKVGGPRGSVTGLHREGFPPILLPVRVRRARGVRDGLPETPTVLLKKSNLIAIVTATIIVGCAPLPDKAGGWNACTNREAGYTATYPGDWKTNSGDVLPSCSLFDPNRVAVSPDTEIPFDIGVTILRQDVPFDEAIEGYDLVEVLEWENLHIDGQRAVRMEFIDQEPQWGLSNQRSYHYLVDLGGQTLAASTHAVGEPDYSRKKGVLDRIMREIRIHD